jgi:hypothetical protein
MFKSLYKILVHPWFIAFLNAGILAILISAVYDIIVTSARPYPEAEEIISGIGVILISWGVALEERLKLREVFGLIPEEESEGSHHHEPYESAIDENCHRYGLGLLLLGLFAEVGVECVRVPDRIINTGGIESEVLYFSSFLLVVSGILMVRQIVFLLFTSRKH